MSIQTFDPAPVLAHYPGLTNSQVGELLGVHAQTISTWRRGHRRLKTNQADRIACIHLGVHPAEIWPEWGTEPHLTARHQEHAL